MPLETLGDEVPRCMRQPNERMQLTWLLGAPSQGRPRSTVESSGGSVSVHPPRS